MSLWEKVLYEATFAGIRLDVTSSNGDRSNSVAEHRSPYKAGSRVEHTGEDPWVESLSLIFTGPDHLERYEAFLRAKAKPDPQLLIHPIHGSKYCLVASCSESISPDRWDTIDVQATFIEHSPLIGVVGPGAGRSLDAEVQNVAAEAARLDSALADMGAESAVPARAGSIAAGWKAPSTTLRKVNLEVVSIANDIAALTEALNVATDIRAWPVIRSLELLQSNVRNAGEAFAATTPRLMEITVLEPVPLLTIAARTYGAKQANARYEELRSLNDVKNPARVEAGTVLKAQSPEAPRRGARIAR